MYKIINYIVVYYLAFIAGFKKEEAIEIAKSYKETRGMVACRQMSDLQKAYSEVDNDDVRFDDVLAEIGTLMSFTVANSVDISVFPELYSILILINKKANNWHVYGQRVEEYVEVAKGTAFEDLPALAIKMFALKRHQYLF